MTLKGFYRKGCDSLSEDNKKEVRESFDQRLKSFEAQVNKPEHKGYLNISKEDEHLWRFVVRAGVDLFSGFIVGVAIGIGLDYWLSTRPLFIIIFSLLGGAAGVLNVWRIVKSDDISST